MTVAIDNGLWKAADVLNDKGFGKSNLVNAQGNVCALGAYNAAYGREPGAGGNAGAQSWANREHHDEMEAVAETIKSLFPDRYSSSANTAGILMSFNDHVKTTKDDLAKVFRVAAVKLATGI